ncbi:Lipoprotein-releasing system transmembrane protein lolE [Candidatus Ornithobacterium hominis]|uniref:ABC transporter permease n=1 Tax=Candidatus Ornithobacterium hominis TaxID=2497989 RepID=UPI0024BCFD31|nr:FtsX-like permease family protein [Candidatus Ornithobacterium hominis]CAI9429156.1 Lipoprotein-releasing system transmembrane protein lolE [Candidatus Ornithobacterium hominis]
MNLPLYIARKYVFSGKNAVEVNIISWIAFIALGFVTACLIVILSVFSGLEKINIQFYSEINPDAQITPKTGKVIENSEQLLGKIQALPEVKAASKVIEERAFIDYNHKNHIVMLKGVDQNFNQIFGLDSMVKIGKPLSTEYPRDIILGQGVSSRLSLYMDEVTPAVLYVPKPGKGLITSKKEAFNTTEAYGTGIFSINDKYSEYVFAQLELVQNLLNYQKGEISAIEIKSATADSKQFLKALKKIIGDDFQIKSREEIDAAFTKMMNTENLIIYLIFFLILIIASFNLAGSVAILILNKRKQSLTLRALGMPRGKIKQSFFYTGVLITIYALFTGLLIGTLVIFLQQEFGLVSINMFMAFPVRFTLQNYLVAILSVLFIGTAVSYFVSRSIALSALQS